MSPSQKKNKMPRLVKRDYKRRMPPNGQFYQDYQDGLSQFPDEPTVLIYIDKIKPWKYANAAIDAGLQPPILIDIYINAFAFIWPVKDLKVRVIEWVEITDKIRSDLALALYLAGAKEIQYQSFAGYEVSELCRKIIPNYESNHKVVRYA